MSHIHIPDGVLPVGWWLAGYVLTILIVLVAVRKIEKEDVRKRVPFLGVISALMLITMSVPVGALPFHINLTVLTGVLAGPWLGFIAVFIVNLLLGFIGHGGITVVGVNTLILGMELVIGWGAFQLFRRYAKQGMAVGIATVVALLLSTVTMFGVVGFSQAGWQYALPHDHAGEEAHLHDGDEAYLHEGVAEEHITETVAEENELTDSELAGEGPTPTHNSAHEGDFEDGTVHEDGTIQEGDTIYDGDTEHETGHINEVAAGANHAHDSSSGENESFGTLLSDISFINLSGFIALALILVIGIALETVVTVFIVNFLKRVRPDLIN